MCPVSGAPIRWPASTSQTITAWSALPDTRRRPSGLKATRYPNRSGFACRLAGLGIPEPERVVGGTGGGDQVSVGG